MIPTNLFFWNLHGNDSTSLIKEALLERDVDIAAFAEHKSVNFDELCNAADFPYALCDPVDGPGRVRVLLRDGIDAAGVFGQNRYIGLTVKLGYRKANIFAVHLEDSRNDSDGATRQETVRRLKGDMKSQEREQNCTDSIAMGDFNVQPFSKEMVWATLLNATFFKEVAIRLGHKTVGASNYTFMYNPTLEHPSEANANCGSYHTSNGADTFYWYCLDQMVVSPSLADSIVEYRYLNKIGTISLVGNIAPRACISDHFPLFVRLNLERG